MGRRMLMRCEALVMVVLLVFVFTGCGGGEEEALVPSTPEEAGTVLVRLSGAQGTAYTGSYGTLGGEFQTVEDTLGDEPQEYEVQFEEDSPDGVSGSAVSASFQKSDAGAGELKAEFVADDVVVAESMTRVPNGSIIVDWIPQGAIRGGYLANLGAMRA